MQKTAFIFFILITCCSACGHKAELADGVDWERPALLLQNGYLDELCTWVDAQKQNTSLYSDIWMRLDSFEQISRRVKLEFSLDEFQLKNQLTKQVGEFSESDIVNWEQRGMLDWRMIDGEKRYFKRAVFNLALQMKKGDGLVDSVLSSFCLKHTSEVVKAVGTSSNIIVKPQAFNVQFTMTLAANAVPAGEIVRCWLPYPKSAHARQTRVELIAASPSDFVVAEDSCLQRSVCLEKEAVAGDVTRFQLQYSFQSCAEYHDMNKAKVLPYDQESELYQLHTAEQLPHIVFTDAIKRLTDSICGEEKRPFDIVRKIYYWIDQNIPWGGALEYSVMSNIPQYVLKHRRGDCGMQTLLFMSMARYKGIPVKWQSGWMLHPEALNLHDWCEVYYQGVGWVPLDMSFGLQDSDDEQIREFYISGIDAYRLTINDGIGAEFHPSKRFLRSEPWDFQRGEMEWSGGNLYFDRWDFELILTQ